MITSEAPVKQRNLSEKLQVVLSELLYDLTHLSRLVRSISCILDVSSSLILIRCFHQIKLTGGEFCSVSKDFVVNSTR